MAYEIKAAYFCHRGRIRPNNEDNYLCCGQFLPEQHEGSEEIFTLESPVASGPLLSVFDGMGGESHGETASFLGALCLDMASRQSKKLLLRSPDRFLRKSCLQMNHEVCAYAAANRISTMGSTVATAAFGRKEFAVCNLGDSRIYLLDGDSLTLLSTDHVTARRAFGKPPLTQYLGLPEEDIVPDPALVRMKYRDGMRLLLCSDGLTDMLSEERIFRILSGQESQPELLGTIDQILAWDPLPDLKGQPQAADASLAALLLLREALAAGGRDNVTCIVCDIHRSEKSGHEIAGPLSRLWDFFSPQSEEPL